jgi:hypothetical protein
MMDDNTLQAYKWALNQNHQSIAARYARTLAEYVKSIEKEKCETKESEK